MRHLALPVLMAVLVSCAPCTTAQEAQGRREKKIAVERAAMEHYEALIRFSKTTGREAVVRHCKRYKRKRVGEAKTKFLKYIDRYRWELAGGVAQSAKFIEPAQLNIYFRDCQAGPFVHVQMEIDETAPFKIIHELVQIDLTPVADPIKAITPTAIAKRLEHELGSLLKKDDFSGAVLIEMGGRIIVREAHGMASERWGVPNTPTTRFNLASMGKMFTGVAATRLVQDGVIDLNDRVGKHVLELKDHHLGKEVTILHLLTHTSGMTHFWTDDFRRDRDKIRSVEDLLPYYKDRSFKFQPGEGWSYSNSGYALLGLVIERASGMPDANPIMTTNRAIGVPRPGICVRA